MDVHERLSPEEAAAGDRLAIEHRHRYLLAAELLRGMRVADVGCGTGYGAAILGARGSSVIGVDADKHAIEVARRLPALPGHVRFEVADAHAFLERLDPGDVDGVVMFEVLEHLEDSQRAGDALRRLAEGGVRLLLSVPNSRALGERNPFHVTDFGWDEAVVFFDGFPDVVLLAQHAAEGSWIGPADAGPVDAPVVALEGGAEAEGARHIIAASGFGGSDALAAADFHASLVAGPVDEAYMRALEEANATLWHANTRLRRSLQDRAEPGGGAQGGASGAASRIIRAGEAERELQTIKGSRAYTLAVRLQRTVAAARAARRSLRG